MLMFLKLGLKGLFLLLKFVKFKLVISPPFYLAEFCEVNSWMLVSLLRFANFISI